MFGQFGGAFKVVGDLCFHATARVAPFAGPGDHHVRWGWPLLVPVIQLANLGADALSYKNSRYLEIILVPFDSEARRHAGLVRQR
jgi:hypothetical protein